MNPPPTESPTSEQITESVLTIIRRDLGDTFTVESRLDAVEGVDSVRLLRLVARIEREFDVELPDEEVFTVATVPQIAELVAAALGAGAAR